MKKEFASTVKPMSKIKVIIWKDITGTEKKRMN